MPDPAEVRGRAAAPRTQPGRSQTRERFLVFPAPVAPGAHHPRSLSSPPQAHRRRGAPWTFDGAAFVEAVRRARGGESLSVPLFDHAHGDPIPVRGDHRDVHEDFGQNDTGSCLFPCAGRRSSLHYCAEHALAMDGASPARPGCPPQDAVKIGDAVRVVLVEGNYLLLPDQPWAALHSGAGGGILHESWFMDVRCAGGPEDTVRCLR